MIQNKKGFALVLIMALLPVAIAAFLAVFSVTGFLQMDLSTKFPCRNEGLITQRKVGPLLERLLSLNARARKLATNLKTANAVLKAAKATGNPKAILAAEARVEIIKIQRQILDHQQKQLIRQSDFLLSRGHNIAGFELQKALSSKSQQMILFRIKHHVDKSSAPRLAVRPDYADTAPTYSPNMNFENDQSLAHSWQYKISMAKPFSHFIKGEFKFQKSCSVTLTKESSRWIAKINKDKSWSKSLW